MKTITATTPPITAWSTPEDVDMAVGSSEEGRQRERGQVRTVERRAIKHEEGKGVEEKSMKKKHQINKNEKRNDD